MLAMTSSPLMQQQYRDVREGGVLEEGIALVYGSKPAHKRRCRNGARMRPVHQPKARHLQGWGAEASGASSAANSKQLSRAKQHMKRFSNIGDWQRLHQPASLPECGKLAGHILTIQAF